MWFLKLHAKVVASVATHVQCAVCGETEQITVKNHVTRSLSFFTLPLSSASYLLPLLLFLAFMWDESC